MSGKQIWFIDRKLVKGHSKIAKLFVSRKDGFELKDSRCPTAFYMACGTSHLNLIKRFMKMWENFGRIEDTKKKF